MPIRHMTEDEAAQMWRPTYGISLDLADPRRSFTFWHYAGGVWHVALFDGQPVIEWPVAPESLLDRRIAIECVVRSMDGLSAEERRATRRNALFGRDSIPDSPNTRWHDEPTWPDGVELGHGATIAELVDDQGEPTW